MFLTLCCLTAVVSAIREAGVFQVPGEFNALHLLSNSPGWLRVKGLEDIRTKVYSLVTATEEVDRPNETLHFKAKDGPESGYTTAFMFLPTFAIEENAQVQFEFSELMWNGKPADLLFLACAKEEWTNIATTDKITEHLCNPNSTYCSFQQRLYAANSSKETLTGSWQADRGGEFAFALYNCAVDKTNISGQFELSVMNSSILGLTHISWYFTPLLAAYLAFLISWSIVLFIWLRNLIEHGFCKPLMLKLHDFMTAVIIVKWLKVVFSSACWMLFSTAGFVSIALASCMFITTFFDYLLFTAMMALLSKGWGVVRNCLNPLEWRTLFSMAFLLAFLDSIDDFTTISIFFALCVLYFVYYEYLLKHSTQTMVKIADYAAQLSRSVNEERLSAERPLFGASDIPEEFEEVPMTPIDGSTQTLVQNSSTASTVRRGTSFKPDIDLTRVYQKKMTTMRSIWFTVMIYTCVNVIVLCIRFFSYSSATPYIEQILREAVDFLVCLYFVSLFAYSKQKVGIIKL